MTIADDDQNPRPEKNIEKSLDAIAALRHAMEQRLADDQTSKETEPPSPSSPSSAASAEPAPEPAPPPQQSQPPEKAGTTTSSSPSDVFPSYDPAEWSRIMTRIAERSQKLIFEFMERNKGTPINIPPFDPARFSEAFSELIGRTINDPERFFQAQMALWQGYSQIWQSTLARLQGKPVEDAVKTPFIDRRFQDQDWQSNWLFDYLKQIYLLTTQQMQSWVQTESAKLDPKLAQKVEFFTRQIADAIAPTNFWLTNPEVLRTIFETGGESLIKGLENLLNDLERGKGDLRISMTDTSAFKVGENLATTPGKVVYQNHLMQLIQYAPSTPTVYQTPLLILPPWINKFYILDLREKNSMIRYLVAQGHTVFIVSWVNPNAKHALVNFEDYMSDGALTAMREVKRLTQSTDVNMVGYCIGGTLLATTLAYLKAIPEIPSNLPNVKSATYFVTLVDFAKPGDLGVFIDEELIKVAEERMAKQGYMDAASISSVFSMLRSNDLIWSYVVHNYMLGKGPLPFDILYWNSDSTNLPAIMHSYYLRRMYLANKLIEPNALSMKNVPIDLRTITTPTFMLSAREDHIAPWKSTYSGTQIYKGPVTFVLADSGHIAGVVNHPSANKYGYRTNNAPCPPSADEWLTTSVAHKGSWWPEWMKWLEPYTGPHVPAREVENGLENAPGSYVKVRAV